MGNPELSIRGSPSSARGLPTISVVTPSFNQAQFLPECISSIADQAYKPIEHIVIDPGSTDGSREIAAKAPSVTLIAEPDRGQSDAICKGFALAKGDVFTWLNSDDRYASNAVFEAVARRFAEADTPDVVYGLVNFVDADGNLVKSGFVNPEPQTLKESFEYQVGVVQPGVFIRRPVFERIGGPSLDLHFALDYEYWVRIVLAGFKWAHLPEVIAEHRWWPGMKTASRRGDSYEEHMRTVLLHFGYVHKRWIERYAVYLMTGADGIVNIVEDERADAEALVSKKRELYEDYNSSYKTRRFLRDNQHRRTIAETAGDMCSLGIPLQHISMPADAARTDGRKDLPGSADPYKTGWNYYYTREEETGRSLVGYEIGDGFHWLFDRIWVRNQLDRWRRALPELREQRKGNTCIIVGNGPSLNKTNIELIGGYDAIISNYAYKNKRLLELSRYITIVNRLVAEQGTYEINRLKSLVKIFPFWLGSFINGDETTHFVNALLKKEFSPDAGDWISWRSTVSFFNMQMAYSLGYRKVLLVGFDHEYKQGGHLKEGAIIDQKEDDENHFDPSYFRGKVWQAADTDNMADVYHLARAAFEMDGREIINCTVGGRLEVFKRSTLEEQLGSQRSFLRIDPNEGPQPTKHASVLILDVTRIGGHSATGQLKQTLFTGWPTDRLMQVYSEGRGIFGVYRETGTGPATRVISNAKELMAACESFAPAVILYRPVDTNLHIHDFAVKIIDRLNVPLITQIVDDWPARLEDRQPKLHKKLDASLRNLFARSYARLSICDAMSIAFRERYGVSFTPIANCIQPDDWTSLDRERKRRTDPDEPFLLRYAGALANDKELQSIVDVAQVVGSLRDEGIDVRFEVHTMPFWESKLSLVARLEGVSAAAAFLPDDEYRKVLVSCDALLLAYNFDEDTTRYMRYSMANSLPEAMASGVPIIAYGPPEVATIAYTAGGKFALQVTERDHSRLRSAILELVSHPERGKELGAKARELAFEYHNSGRVRERFQSLLCEAAAQHEKPAIREALVSGRQNDLVGPFERRRHADFNENKLVAALPSGKGAGAIMIDVGAHHGSALVPFAKKGWRVYAFEPDIQNRSILDGTVSAFRNVSVDKRAVSDATERSIPFYSSSESSGISSLSRFTSSHFQSGTVDTVTLAGFCGEQKISHIDFLKIDVEGYDFQVLKGVPWDRIKPNVIICEFEDRKTRSLGYTMPDMARYLTERGYTVLVSEWHPIIRYGVKHDWHRLLTYPCELNHPDAWGNLIAFRDQPNLHKVATIAGNIVKGDAEIAKRGGTRVTGLRDRGLYERLVGYLKRNYPMIITIGRFGMWGLSKLKRTFFGIGGIALLVIGGLYVAGALIEPLRWYLVGIATALLLMAGGLLGISYARFMLNRFIGDQRRSIQGMKEQSIKDRTQLQASLDRLTKEISDSRDTLAKMNVGNFALFQQFNRRLTNDDLKRFAGEWGPKLGLNLDARALAYIAHRICLAEDTCIGRLAGNIETMLLRVLIARAVKEANLEVLEIGTMFGVGVAMIHENCRGFFGNVHLTVIDPLSGYYGSDQLDIVTKMPVTRDMFVHNMQRMNIPQSDYTIIEKLSTEEEAIEQASRKRYNLLIIDGDHSYPGVKHDFCSYRHLVKRGGYIVFDDYNSPIWPQVKDFVDKEVVGLPELEFIGADAYTAVFRVMAPQDLTRQSATTVATITTKNEGRAGAASPALTGRDTAPDPSVDYPKHVAFETSATCNARCDFCPQSELARRGHVMQMELIEKIISELSEIPSSRFPEIIPVGVNEPLTDKRIFDILNFLSSKLPSARIYFVTNGNLLSEEAIAELSKHNLSRLCISLNFCDKKTYEQRTGLQWKKTLAAMSILHEKAASGEFRHPVSISRVGDGSEYDNAFARWVGANYPAFRHWLKRAGDWLGHVPNLSHRPHEVSSKCPEWHRMHIDATGVVRRCCMDADAQYPWGDVKTMNLLDVFNLDEWRALRRGQRSRSEVHPCDKCTYY